MRTRSIHLSGRALLAIVLAAAGCNTVPAPEYAKVQRELIDAQSRISKLEEQVAAKQQVIDVMKGQVAELRSMKPENLEQLIVPVSIEMERLSGGYDEDGQPGDDGLVLYVRPIDRNADVVKAAGSLKIALLDLANPPDDYLLGEYLFDLNKTRELWYGRLWTSHFAVHCPWHPDKPPAHGEITARVEFHELLTGRTLTTQGVYKIKLRPGPVAGKTR